MTTQRGLKKVIRERMAVTGESYTQAKTALIDADIEAAHKRVRQALVQYKFGTADEAKAGLAYLRGEREEP